MPKNALQAGFLGKQLHRADLCRMAIQATQFPAAGGDIYQAGNICSMVRHS